ncbi:hypothetical protein HK096_001634 [Nowakowskiella sp. JEL0078]|nr:hypothetical protein HK096_001634 [Nowakowskiella sp. JEL0078]
MFIFDKDKLPGTASSLQSLFDKNIQPSAQTQWSPLCPPVVDSEGFVIYALAASAFGSNTQTFLRILVLDVQNVSPSGDSIGNFAQMTDLSLPGSYFLKPVTGRAPGFLGLAADDVSVLLWTGLDVGSAVNPSIYSIFVKKSGKRASNPQWAFTTSTPLSFGPSASIVFKPTFSLDSRWLFLLASNGTNSDPCLLRYNITATASNSRSEIQDCKAVGVTRLDDFVLFSQQDTSGQQYISPLLFDFGENQPFFINSDLDLFNISWASLPVVTGFQKTTLTSSTGTVAGEIQLTSSLGSKGWIVSNSNDNLTLLSFSSLSPEILKSTWSLSNAALLHSDTKQKRVIAVDDQRGWIYVCVNMTAFSIPSPNATNFASVGPIGLVSGSWNGSVVVLKSSSGNLVLNSTMNPSINGCSIDSSLIFRNNGFMVSGPSLITLYEIVGNSTFAFRWSIPANSSSPSSTQQPYLLPPIFRNSTLLTGSGQALALAYTHIPSPSPVVSSIVTASPTPVVTSDYTLTIVLVVILVVCVIIFAIILLVFLRYRKRKKTSQASITRAMETEHEGFDGSVSTGTHDLRMDMSVARFPRSSGETSNGSQTPDLENDTSSNLTAHPKHSYFGKTVFTESPLIANPKHTVGDLTSTSSHTVVTVIPPEPKPTTTPDSDYKIAPESDGISTQTDANLLVGIKGNPNLVHGVGESDNESQKPTNSKRRNDMSSPPTRTAPTPNNQNPLNFSTPRNIFTNFQNTSESALSDSYHTAPESGDNLSLRSFSTRNTNTPTRMNSLSEFPGSFKSTRSYLTDDDDFGYYASESESSFSIKSPFAAAGSVSDFGSPASPSWLVGRRSSVASTVSVSTIRPQGHKDMAGEADNEVLDNVDFSTLFPKIELERGETVRPANISSARGSTDSPRIEGGTTKKKVQRAFDEVEASDIDYDTAPE